MLFWRKTNIREEVQKDGWTEEPVFVYKLSRSFL